MAVTIRSEKGTFITISEGDQNFIELRDVINDVNTLINDTSAFLNDYNTLENNVNIIKTEHLKRLNNLSDLQSNDTARSVLDIYSKTEANNTFFEVDKQLTNANVNGTLNTLGIGKNALRDSNMYGDELSNPPEYTSGENGDLWYNYGILDGVISLVYDVDNPEIGPKNFNFNRFTGNVVRKRGGPTYKKIVFADNHFYAIDSLNNLVKVNKNNLNNVETIVENVIDFDVSYYDLSSFNPSFNATQRQIVYVKDNNVIGEINHNNAVVEKIADIDVQNNGETIQKIMCNKNNQTIYFLSQNRGGVLDTFSFDILETNRLLNKSVRLASDATFYGDSIYYVDNNVFLDIIKFNPTLDTSEVFYSNSNPNNSNEPFVELEFNSNGALYAATNLRVHEIDGENISYLVEVKGNEIKDMKISMDGFLYFLSTSNSSGTLTRVDLSTFSIDYEKTLNDYVPGQSIGIFPGDYNSGFWEKYS